jgi:hypothetical protein
MNLLFREVHTAGNLLHFGRTQSATVKEDRELICQQNAGL